MKRCTNCVMPETRPRITFNEQGVCNACQWAEEKKTIDWNARQDFFRSVADRLGPQCIVPWSGGKDSIYVAHKMRGFGLEPTLMCVVPHLETKIGEWNRYHTCPTFEKVFISLSDEKYRTLARKYFVEQGRPKHPWECAISAVILRQAVELNIPLVVYGEEGEAEYGGVMRERDRWMKPVDKEYLMSYYYQGNLDWPLPEDEQFDKLWFTQWSRFENWSPSEHGAFAVMNGMRTEPIRNIGSLSTYSQLSDKLQDLHMYLAFIKFGFGRCAADTSIAIRDGWMKRDEAVEWCNKYDGEYPWRYHDEYLQYFQMSDAEYWAVIDKWANQDIVRRDKRNRWVLKELFV